jgi:rRNA-processing protein FCF1
MISQADNSRIERALRSYKTLADTSFVMQPGLSRFISDYAHLISNNPILLSRLVLDELHRLAERSNDKTRCAAKRGLNVLGDLLRFGYAQVRYEAIDTYADLVIQRVVEQHLLTHDFLVLTNDVGLMKDLYAKTCKKSVRSSRDLIVAKLNAASQKLQIFTPSKRPSARPAKPSIKTASSPGAPTPFNATSSLSLNAGTKLNARTAIESGDQLKLSDGSAVKLGSKLASGGEGTVFEILGSHRVCKIYHPERLTLDREQKIRLMLTRKLADPAICWPLASILDKDGVFRGYVMDRASGKPLAHGLFVPQLWQKENPAWNRHHSTQLAINILRRISYLHHLNVLLGDINPLNILVKDENSVYFVDCDSYQIEGFACPVGTVNFTAPEIQGRDFSTFLRTGENELFAVATLLFMILMPGKSPYSHQGGQSGYLNIKEMHFAYPLGANHSNGVPLGPWRFCWSHLTFGIKQAFYKSFHNDHRQEPRVALSTWLRLLNEYEQLLGLPTHAFHGPKRRVGFDLSILPQNLRIVVGQDIPLQQDGQTDMEREFQKLRINHVGNVSSAGPFSRFIKPTPAPIPKPIPVVSRVQRPIHARPAVAQPNRLYRPAAPQQRRGLIGFVKKLLRL